MTTITNTKKWRQKQQANGRCIECTRPAVISLRGTLGVFCNYHRKLHSENVKKRRWAKLGTPKRLVPLDYYAGTDPVLLSYAGALIDGEGAIGFLAKGSVNTLSPYVAVSMTDQEPVWFMSFTFGKKVSFRPSKESNRKGFWVWRVSGKAAGALCQALLPYIRIERKRKLAEYAVEFSKLMHYNSWRVNSDKKMLAKREAMREEIRKFYLSSPSGRGPDLGRTWVGQ